MTATLKVKRVTAADISTFFRLDSTGYFTERDVKRRGNDKRCTWAAIQYVEEPYTSTRKAAPCEVVGLGGGPAAILGAS